MKDDQITRHTIARSMQALDHCVAEMVRGEADADILAEARSALRSCADWLFAATATQVFD